MRRAGAPAVPISGWPLAVGAIFVAGSLLRILAFLGTTPLATLDRAPWPAANRPAGPVLLHVFQAEDCSRFRELVRRWNELHRRHGLPVLGVGLDLPDDPGERERLIRASGAAFPVRRDRDGRVERLLLRLGHARTPLAVLLDTRGRPRLVLAPSPGPDGPDAAARAILAVSAALTATQLPGAAALAS